MANFNEAIALVLKHEGGFSHHKDDPGGATNMGITYSTYRQYAVQLGLTVSIQALKNLTINQVAKIYKIGYWDKIKGDRIKDQQVANLIFDSYVNMGNQAIRIAQGEVGLLRDGKFGELTLAAINKADPKILFNRIKQARVLFYRSLVMRKPNMKVFAKGWSNRIESFRYV